MDIALLPKEDPFGKLKLDLSLKPPGGPAVLLVCLRGTIEAPPWTSHGYRPPVGMAITPRVAVACIGSRSLVPSWNRSKIDGKMVPSHVLKGKPARAFIWRKTGLLNAFRPRISGRMSGAGIGRARIGSESENRLEGQERRGGSRQLQEIETAARVAPRRDRQEEEGATIRLRMARPKPLARRGLWWLPGTSHEMDPGSSAGLRMLRIGAPEKAQ